MVATPWTCAGEGQESLWPQGGLVFLERRGSAGPGQVSLLAAGRALATAPGRASCSHLGQEAQLQPSPAAREGESRLGWEISTAQTCLCQAAGPAKGLLLGSLLGKACSFLISFPLIAPAPLLWLELHLALRVSQVQDPKAGWFYPDNVYFKVWIKSGQGNTAHDAWGKPSPVTCDSSACRNSGESTAWQSETSG